MADNLPLFDERGCLSKGIYNPSVQDFLERFVNVSKRRKELFGKYQKFTKLCIDAKGIEQHFVDGSYVTNKEKPGDIDLLLTFNDDVYDSEESYNKYFEITQKQKKMKEDYEVHVFFAKDTTDVDPLDIQRFWDMEKKKVLDWWARFYIDGENNIVDGKNKGFIVFYKDELRKIGA